MATLINFLMAALSTIVMPTKEEPLSNEIMLRHEIIVMNENLTNDLPADCCILK